MTRIALLPALLLTFALPATAQDIDLGDNSSEWANDGECDDPRFTGDGMAWDMDEVDMGRDAADCGALLKKGRIRLSRVAGQSSPAECAAIDFGADTGAFTGDRECDDPRFAGPGVDEILLGDDLGTDASDCRTLCEAGSVWLK